MESLTETMRNARLGGPSEDPEHLLFNPQEGSGLAPTALDEIPRYLFRVASPHSDGLPIPTERQMGRGCVRSRSIRTRISLQKVSSLA